MSYSGNPTVKRFKTDMQDLVKQVAVDLRTAFNRQADELIENMRGAVPTESGHLKHSIRKRDVTKTYGNWERPSVLVLAGGHETTHGERGGPYDYALAIEFGTHRMKAEPFFYPTWRRYKQSGRKDSAETVAEAIEKNNKMRWLRSEGLTGVGIK